MALNQVILGGNLTRDPEQRYTNSGTEIASFGIAQNEKWTDSNGNKQEKAHFFDCVAFGGLAGVINEHFHKGKPIIVIGKNDYSTWEAQDGTTRSKVQIKVLGFEFVSDGGGGKQNGGQRQQRQQVEIDESEFEDIPF